MMLSLARSINCRDLAKQVVSDQDRRFTRQMGFRSVFSPFKAVEGRMECIHLCAGFRVLDE